MTVITAYLLGLATLPAGDDPGDKAILGNGRWTPHSRSQFRINLNDIAAIYQQVRRVDVRDFRERP